MMGEHESTWQMDAYLWMLVTMMGVMAALTGCLYLLAPLVLLVPLGLYSLGLYAAEWATQGTIKLGHHDPSNALCACGTCEATGRWFKRPLPKRAWADDAREWVCAHANEGDGFTAADQRAIIDYLVREERTAQVFLADWATQQRPLPLAPPATAKALHRLEREAGAKARADATPDRWEQRSQVAEVRAALEHLYRQQGINLPPAVEREAEARALIDKGYTAQFAGYDGGIPHYALLAPVSEVDPPVEGLWLIGHSPSTCRCQHCTDQHKALGHHFNSNTQSWVQPSRHARNKSDEMLTALLKQYAQSQT